MEEHPYVVTAARETAVRPWLYLLVLAGIAVVFVCFQTVLMLPLFLGVSMDPRQWPAVPYLLVAMAPFAVVAPLLWLALRFFHHRPFMTLLTARPRFSWRNFGIAAVLWFLLNALGDLFLSQTLLRGEYGWAFDPAAFFPFAALALLLVPIQTSAEELFFRGYLMQGLGQWLRRPWIPLVISSIGFGLLHGANVEVSQYGAWLMMPYYIGTGFFLGWLVLKTCGLEASLAVHWATNLYSTVFVTFPGSSLPAPALFQMERLDPAAALVAYAVSVALFLVVFLRLNPASCASNAGSL